MPEGLDDGALEAALFPAPPPSRVRRPEPDWGRVHQELHRHKGVTLQLLWLEYRAAHPGGYQYSWYCERYRAWREQLDVVVRQVYRADEKAFVDYAGPKFEIVDRKTGEVQGAMVFVGVLGASNHTFVDVTLAGETGDILDLRLREGQVHTAYGGLEFVLEVLERAERHLCGKAAVRFRRGISRRGADGGAGGAGDGLCGPGAWATPC